MSQEETPLWRDDEANMLRFRREMELSQRAKHPNLARTLGVGQEEDVYFMILEYIPGESLYEAVKGERGGPLRVPDTARFFLKVLDGLEAAHAELSSPLNNLSIRDVALKWGFTHMGHFAARYRAAYHVAPSETARLARAESAADRQA